MKKIIYSLFVLLVICSASYAQQDTIKVVVPPPTTAPPPAPAPAPAPAAKSGGIEKRINLYGIYTFDDSFNSTYDDASYYDGKIKGGFQYGAGIEFMVKPTYGVELLYIGQSTSAPTIYYPPIGGSRSGNLDLNFNYAMLAFGRHMMKPGSAFEGYGGIMLGALFSSADNKENGDHSSGTHFAWGIRLGGNIWASEKFAIKLQGQLLSAVQDVGGGLYLGTGGAGAGVSTYSSMLQFGVGGGIAFKLGQ